MWYCNTAGVTLEPLCYLSLADHICSKRLFQRNENRLRRAVCCPSCHIILKLIFSVWWRNLLAQNRQKVYLSIFFLTLYLSFSLCECYTGYTIGGFTIRLKWLAKFSYKRKMKASLNPFLNYSSRTHTRKTIKTKLSPTISQN